MQSVHELYSRSPHAAAGVAAAAANYSAALLLNSRVPTVKTETGCWGGDGYGGGGGGGGHAGGGGQEFIHSALDRGGYSHAAAAASAAAAAQHYSGIPTGAFLCGFIRGNEHVNVKKPDQANFVGVQLC